MKPLTEKPVNVKDQKFTNFKKYKTDSVKHNGCNDSIISHL